jgi:Glycosyl transferase family 2
MVSVDAGDALALSVVVVTHDMERELPRTLRSLATPYQQGIERGDYEVVVVDNGSARAVAPTRDGDPAVRLLRLDDATVSPARAANVGLAAARGEVIGLIIDGARMASPGLLGAALLASTMVPRPVVTAPAWHLGASLQVQARTTGYDQAAEDVLLAEAQWEDDGYALFSVSTPAASSARGLFGPMGESSSLFLHRETWAELGGVDERFSLPGGGLVNHDLYRRACTLGGAQLVVLLGEGTFHQIHGGAATSGRVTREEMRADYEAIIGEPHRPPPNRALYIGSIPSTYLPYLAASIDLARSGRRQPAGERL